MNENQERISKLEIDVAELQKTVARLSAKIKEFEQSVSLNSSSSRLIASLDDQVSRSFVKDGTQGNR